MEWRNVMSNWYLVVVVILAVVGILLFMRSRNAEATRRDDERREQSRPGPAHIQDREDARLANMSAEDRDWETATLQRNRENEARSAALAK
jgi:flagellar biosynthesis/type III secretory pathway M-ring protein FliF/YscJ